MNQSSLKGIFNANRDNLICQIKKFISNQKQTNTEKYNYSRKYILDYVIKANFGKAITFLEEFREYKHGIIIYKLFTPNFPPVLIRDARNCKLKTIRDTESFEIQYLNLIRSSLDIIRIEKKENLLPEIIRSAVNFIKDFQYQIYRSQEDIQYSFQFALNDLVLLLESIGIEDALHKLDIAKNFQNFNYLHADVVTISSLKDKDKNYIIFEAEVALRRLTTNQLQEYKNILESKDNTPEWYKNLSILEQKLCKKYAPKIINGNHVISSQLVQIVGMRNAFEKITGIIVNDDNFKSLEVKILHKSKHSGCLASFSRHKKSRQHIANLNAEQGQEWIGAGMTLHCNTFNSGPNNGKKNDKIIVKQTIKAMKHIKGMVTNTAYDSFRQHTGANFYHGIKYLIDNISKSINKSKDLDYIKFYLKPQKEKGEYISKNQLQEHLKLLQDNKIISIKTYNVLRIIIDMKDKVKILERGSTGFLNMEISMNLNILQNIINDTIISDDFNGLDKRKLPRQEILNMCALGLDRTGFAEHIQSIKLLEYIVLKKVTSLDKKLIAGGHTSQIAGATYFGGGTIGCYGIKNDSIVYFPKKRLKSLSGLLKLSASGNKLTSIK